MDPDYDEGAADEELFAQELELLARKAFAEYLADGDAAEERADDVLEMDELRPIAQTVTASSWSGSLSCIRSDLH